MASLLDKRLIIVTGKGGVGKSTISAALSLLKARSGLRTLLCEINTQDRIGPLLGARSVGPAISPIDENLWGLNIQPEQAMREYALMLLKLESIYNAVFENRFVRYFLRFIPSLQELVMLGKIIHHLDEKLPDGAFKYQVVVVDGPATGHAISFLNLPRVLLHTIPPGPMARAAKHMRETLENEEVTAVALVSLPEEMPVNETIELSKTLRERAQIGPQMVILNGFVHPRFTESDLEALRAMPSLRSLALDHQELAKASADFCQRLETELHLPLVPLPRLFQPDFGRPAIEALSRYLQSATEGG
jgi:anion-transporting  ArsA/GET3 family ATPase